MERVQDAERSLILNETSMTIHKRELGADEFQTACGHLTHVGPEKLQIIGTSALTENHNTSKCGQCFEEGGGY